MAKAKTAKGEGGVLSDALRKTVKRESAGPIWTGPAGTGSQGGVTQSLLGRYLGCKERYRLFVMDGWRTRDVFVPRMEFGNLWHACEEAYAAGWVRGPIKQLDDWVHGLLKRYPDSQAEIIHWYELTCALFPEYVDHWLRHPDTAKRTPLLQEQRFDVPYSLPSGRTVRLRGKWDSVDLVSGEDGQGVWIQENKTKSKIDTAKIARQCSFDLQSMFYLTAYLKYTASLTPEGWRTMRDGYKIPSEVRLGGALIGVRYNCIRRPGHKTVDSAMKTFGVDSRNGRIEEWFARWEVRTSQSDLTRFRFTCLDPLLENLLDDYEWWSFCFQLRNQTQTNPHLREFNIDNLWDYEDRAKRFPAHRARHFRYPFGIYNPLEEAGGTDLDALLDNGDTANLRRVDDLFPELA